MSETKHIVINIRTYSNQIYFVDSQKTYDLKEWSIGESFEYFLKLVLKERVFEEKDIVHVQFDGQFKMKYALTFQVHDIDIRQFVNPIKEKIFIYRLGAPVYDENSVVYI